MSSLGSTVSLVSKVKRFFRLETVKTSPLKQDVRVTTKMDQIHPTAILDESRGEISLGLRNKIGAYCVLMGPLVIGDDNEFHPFCVIGDDPEHKGKKPHGNIEIGHRNIFREHTIVHRSAGKRDTSIGNDNYFMHGSHVAHDCLVGSRIRLSPYVVLGGHTVVLDDCTLGIATVTHQNSTIGQGTMTGMHSTITKDPPPFSMIYGSPAKWIRHNTYMLDRLKGSHDVRMSEVRFFTLKQGRETLGQQT